MHSAPVHVYTQVKDEVIAEMESKAERLEAEMGRRDTEHTQQAAAYITNLRTV